MIDNPKILNGCNWSRTAGVTDSFVGSYTSQRDGHWRRLAHGENLGVCTRRMLRGLCDGDSISLRDFHPAVPNDGCFFFFSLEKVNSSSWECDGQGRWEVRWEAREHHG